MTCVDNSNLGSILVSDGIPDHATVQDATAGETGFPATNVLDPQPATRWRINTDTGAGGTTTPFIILDLRNFFGPWGINTVPTYDYFGIYFHNSFSGIGAPDNTWRVQTGDTTTGTGNFDSGTLDLWTLIDRETDRNTFKDSDIYFPPGITSHHLVTTQTLGGGSGLFSEVDRFVRIDFDVSNNEAGNRNFFEVGRIVIGKAIRTRVPVPGNKPVPSGTPAKKIITWDVVMTRQQFEEFYYLLPLVRGSKPRVLRSWGHDVFPVDGAGRVVAVNDVLAPDPWTRHQGTVYGYLEDFSLVAARSEDNHRVQISLRGL